jgi:hypothetical protein
MFEDEYVRLVIKPKIDMILEDGVESIPDLTRKFNTAYECKVSKARITDWLKGLGYRVTRVVQIDGPAKPTRAPAPVHVPAREEYNTTHRQSQFNFMPPPQMGAFTNVVMPGQED